MSAAIDADIATVDDFLGKPKKLRGFSHPPWERTGFAREWGASWPIEDDLGVIMAQMKFRCKTTRLPYPTINLIIRRRPIWRIDLVPANEQKANPHWAQKLGLPPVVVGSHGHEWPDHREYIGRSEHWELPARRPLPANITTLEQLLPWFAERINLELTPDQRGFNVPAQSELV